MQKKPIILIVCGAIVVLAIVLLIIYLAQGGSTDPKDIIKQNKTVIEPEIELSAFPTEETDDRVTIYINASIKEGKEIASITLPDGTTTAYNEDTKYDVYENGDYTFTITSSEGVSTSKTINISNIIKLSADNPYIPEGFKHIENTEVDSGFIIEDKYGNQFVWIPVATGKLVRTTENNDQYYEDDFTSNGLYNSVANYYGFYIARYESGREYVNGLSIATSVQSKIPWSNVTYEEAYSAALNTATAYNYIGVRTALVNSYAWDTALNWLNIKNTNYSSSTSYGNYSGTILETGKSKTDKVNEIYDMAGNLREWTTESYDPRLSDVVENEDEGTKKTGYRVVRGGSANISKIANSRIGEREDLSDTYWGFRMILYKE